MLTARMVPLLVLLLIFSLHCAAAHFTPTECCFEYAQKPIRHIQSFYETPSNCPLHAVVFVAATGAEVCTNPRKPWVKKAMKKLQRK
ncbi:PREDICTED: C-C motif chemokine 5-like [Leptosomus discolor]|uniref:C-C motif chemokine 5-like n=1 Tax=Leptosomus discolor TaxID=188344 RepID=UPI0005224058|nr:PREDICTED: C-C motif chemokine 5-like [Leptosomus discolor]